MAKMAKTYPDKRGFFEMVRFDFVLDSKLGVYLMEVNMSPNLSSGHFAQNRLLYEQAVYTLLRSVSTLFLKHVIVVKNPKLVIETRRYCP